MMVNISFTLYLKVISSLAFTAIYSFFFFFFFSFSFFLSTDGAERVNI